MITERLIASDYILYAKRQSQIDPTKTLRIDNGFGCPACGHVNRHTLNHGQPTKCETCGLELTRWGNSLECTK